MRFLLLFAHGSGSDIEKNVDSLGIKSVLVALLVLAFLLVVATRTKSKLKYKSLKKPLFILISLTVLIPALLLTGSNVYLNTVSETKGSVHWKTDVEFWVCDQEIELRNPSGLFNNRIGSANLHEHDDKTIYLDGPVISIENDASLKKFLELSGGDISINKLIIPTEENVFENNTDGDENTGDQALISSYVAKDDQGKTTLTVENGNSCLSRGGYAEVQAFLFTFNNGDNTYSQEKLEQPEKFALSEKSTGSPGQCLIVEFDGVKDYTDKLCKSFGEIDAERCESFGVKKYDPSVCRAQEIRIKTKKIIPYKEML